MRRRGLGSEAMAVLAMMDAEDRAVNYLATLPQHLAVVAAVKAAAQLAEAWEIEQGEMLRRGDRRRVYLSTSNERFWLDAAVRKYCGEPSWEDCPAAEVRSHFAGLPADAAALAAYRAAQYTCRHERITQARWL